MEGTPFCYTYTSKQRAEILLNAFYKKGYFKDSNGVTYPACNIKQARIIELKGE